MLVAGQQFPYRSPLGFVMRGADLLVGAGFVPSRLRDEPEGIAGVMEQARECDRIAGDDFLRQGACRSPD